MSIEDLAGSTAERMTAQLEPRRNTYEPFEHEIRLTIRTLELLHDLLTHGRQRPTRSEMVKASRRCIW